MKKFLVGETVTIEDEFRIDGTLTTPDTTSTIEIDDPLDANVEDAQTMTEVSTGIMRYNYTPAAGAVCGVYIADCIYVHGGLTRKSRHKFQLAKEID